MTVSLSERSLTFAVDATVLVATLTVELVVWLTNALATVQARRWVAGIIAASWSGKLRRTTATAIWLIIGLYART